MITDLALARPRACDLTDAGAWLVLDDGGAALRFDRGAGARTVALDEPGRSARFFGDRIAVLCPDAIRLFDADGAPLGRLAVRTGATALAATASGALLVGYGADGAADHGVTLARLGAEPVAYQDPTLRGVTALAPESGGVWVADASARVVRLRPARDGFVVRASVALPAPPRAACVGPDGALYVVLEPGESVVRVDGDAAGDPAPAPPLHDVARGARSLWGCGPGGLVDLTELVPPPGDGPSFELPACSA